MATTFDPGERHGLIPAKLTVPAKGKASPERAALARAGHVVPHVGLEEVTQVAGAARRIAASGGTRGRGNAERDELLVLALFDPALRASEALRLRPQDVADAGGHPRLRVFGKGRKHAAVSVSRSFAEQLLAYAYRRKLGPGDPFFPFTRVRAHQIVSRAFQAAGVAKPDGVGTLHVLRHSGAIERLRRTGNPRAVQEQLRHSTPTMTLCYLKTLTVEEALKVQDQVDFGW